MPPLRDLSGKVFGRLTALKVSSQRGPFGKIMWECRCECGGYVSVVSGALVTGNTKSCGCLQTESRIKHGNALRSKYSSEYMIWRSMRNRCHSSSIKQYKNYGARGISVCERWRNSFQHFLSDMGKRPFPGACIDRIDNSGNYEPSNCRWATQRENLNNRRNTILLSLNGEALPLSEWSRKIGISYATLRHRLDKGWGVEAILTTPVNKNMSRSDPAKTSAREIGKTGKRRVEVVQ